MVLVSFAALVNKQNEYLLNGLYQISRYPMKIDVPGASLFYSGSETIEERINSTGTLGEDLQLQVKFTTVFFFWWEGWKVVKNNLKYNVINKLIMNGIMANSVFDLILVTFCDNKIWWNIVTQAGMT